MPDTTLSEAARPNDGMVLIPHLRELGLSRAQVDALVEKGALERITDRPGVLIVPGLQETWDRSIRAAVLAAGAAAATANLSATRLLCLDAPKPVVHEVIVPIDRAPRLKGVKVHRTNFLPPSHLTSVRGIPCMTAERAIASIAGQVSVKALERCVDEALRSGVVTEKSLADIVQEVTGGRRKIKPLRDILGKRIPGLDLTESDLQAWVLKVLVAAGLPMPEIEHFVVLDDRKCFIDLAWPELMIAMEVVGWEPHRWRRSFDGDRARTNDLTLAGWLVLEFTSAMTPDVIVSKARKAIAVRS